MVELVKIQENNGKKAVSARELYENLGFNKANWAKWYKKNILNNQFAVENEDYQTLILSMNGNETQDFALSIDFAKKLSMLARTDQGEKIRNYFVEVEKVALSSAKPLSTIEILELTLKGIKEQNLELQEIKSEVKELKAKTDNSSNYISVMGYARIKEVKIGLHLAAQIGTKAKAYCKEKGYSIETVPDPRFGKVNIYPFEAVEQAFNQIIVA